MFLESSEVIFKVAISLFEIHKDNLMERDSFEDIMDYLKEVVPKIDSSIMDKVMRNVIILSFVI